MNAQENNSERAVVETVTRYVGHEVSLTDDFANDVGLDSIDRVNLMTTIEQSHGIELSDEEIASINNLRDLLILTKTGQEKNGPDAGEKGRDAATPRARRRRAPIQPKGGGSP